MTDAGKVAELENQIRETRTYAEQLHVKLDLAHDLYERALVIINRLEAEHYKLTGKLGDW